MARIFDTGNLVLDDGGSTIAQNNWSDLKEVTLNDYAAKVIKIILEFTDCSAVSGKLYIFSEANGSWSNSDGASQSPVGTTGDMWSFTCDATYEINDTSFYVANNDSTVVKKIYLAYWNTNADTCKVKVRVLYESLALA